ncbi:MAG: sugar porter (SP) family MFS transporter [Glaciecola sp.]|jgi:sugar porter (SP) family MFS transporter
MSKSVYFAIVVALGGFVFGFDASVISGVVGFVTTEFKLTDWQQGFVVSSPTLGALFGSLFAGFFADMFGRKKVIIAIAFLYVVSAIFSALAVSYSMLVTARIIGGIAFASLVVAPIYIAEISPAKIRGKMISINQLNIVIGLSFAYFANYYLLQLSDSPVAWVSALGIEDNVWRWMLGLEIVPAFIFLVLLFTIPESPRWLALNNREAQAKVVLLLLNDHNSAEPAMTEERADAFIEEIKADRKEAAKGKKDSIFNLLKSLFSKKMRFVLLVGLVVAICQQATGVNAIYFYAPSIFEQSGVGQNAAFSQAIWVGVINVVFTIVAMLLIDRLGRKPLMLIGLAGVFISMSIASYGFHNATYQLTETSIQSIESEDHRTKLMPILGETFSNDVSFKNATIELLGADAAREHQSVLIEAAVTINSVIVLIGILGFVAAFAVSLGPVMWVLLAEILPNRLRGIGIACIGAVNSAVSFSVQLLFPWELANLGTAMTFMIYGLLAIVGFVLIYKMLPETKGRSLEEIEGVFGVR